MKNLMIGSSLLTWLLFFGTSCSRQVENFEYASDFYMIQLTDSLPFIRYFSADGLGEKKLGYNTIRWKTGGSPGKFELRRISGSEVEIVLKGTWQPLWLFKFEDKKFTITSYFSPDTARQGLDFRFNKLRNHATLLGLMEGKRKTRLPAVLHMPDMGTFQIRSDKPQTIVDYSASRKPGNQFISVKLPCASSEQGSISYTFQVASIFAPAAKAGEESWAGYRRNYLNIFQVNPSFQVLANNSCSDPCAFTLFLSSMMALKTPPLVDSLKALDLVRMSVERYLNGMKAYGLVGYGKGEYKGEEIAVWKSPYNSLDAWPSLVIASCNYILGSNDREWAGRYFPRIKEWMEIQMSRDRNGNGLVEYELSGNSGSWDGVTRPANWWDTIGFAHEDAFSNALTYEALRLIARVAEMTGAAGDAERYHQLAGKLKESYFPTFFHPKTGILAGWKSSDGKLHDYYFLMVNSMAVYYDLVPGDKAPAIMTALWKKMQEVGYTDFSLGLPGNLVSVWKADYTHPDPNVGGGQLEDGSDAFQRYENGGASLNWSYFTLMAYQKSGLKEPYEKISQGIMKGITAGDFQGYCNEGAKTRDWRSWTGECWGYEGFLCDGYLALLAYQSEK